MIFIGILLMFPILFYRIEVINTIKVKRFQLKMEAVT
ncbi:MAG: hypothetical protein Q616_SPPC00426G0001 [Streptococcus parasanguinis DORA_23_24]|nr:MAG: hypothetical protein Q616_SPPC00426G0001 [Streptococcus parasanguinis DORA_23_24]